MPSLWIQQGRTRQAKTAFGGEKPIPQELAMVVEGNAFAASFEGFETRITRKVPVQTLSKPYRELKGSLLKPEGIRKPMQS